MPAITTASLTLRGQVSSRVAKVFVDGTEILLTGRDFAHTFTAPASGMLIFTTVDLDGRSESRAVRVTTTSQPALAPPLMPTAAG